MSKGKCQHLVLLQLRRYENMIFYECMWLFRNFTSFPNVFFFLNFCRGDVKKNMFAHRVQQENTANMFIFSVLVANSQSIPQSLFLSHAKNLICFIVLESGGQFSHCQSCSKLRSVDICVPSLLGMFHFPPQ